MRARKWIGLQKNKRQKIRHYRIRSIKEIARYVCKLRYYIDIIIDVEPTGTGLETSVEFTPSFDGIRVKAGSQYDARLALRTLRCVRHILNHSA